MAGTSEWAEVVQLVMVAGGTTGVIAVFRYFADRRREQSKDGVDMQKVLADSAAQTIERLQRLHNDCEARHKECQARVEAVEARVDDLEGAIRVVPLLRQRDDILRNHIVASGATMPPLPQVNWAEVEYKTKRPTRGGAD